MDFIGARDDGVAVASAGPYAKNLLLSLLVKNSENRSALFQTQCINSVYEPSLSYASQACMIMRTKGLTNNQSECSQERTLWERESGE